MLICFMSAPLVQSLMQSHSLYTYIDIDINRDRDRDRDIYTSVYIYL